MNAVLTVQNDILSSDNLDDLTRIDWSTPGDGGQLTYFAYDGLDRLKTAWTENASCANYTTSTADGPAGFNTQYAYAANGVPTSVTSLGAATTYTAGATSHPHAITGFGANSYGYDVDGQQTSRTVSGVASTLSWDPLHLLYRSVASTASTSYVDAPDGTRIARLDPDGSTTIWLPGNEVRVASGVTTATRYYSFGGATIGLRNSDGLTWLASDGQNSRQLAVNASTGTATRSYYTPYGAVRSGASSLPTDQNFLGRVLDSTTGLVQDGARYYDPSMGQFLSTANNPVAVSDPSGLRPMCDQGDICGTTGSGSTSFRGGAGPARIESSAGDGAAEAATADDAVLSGILRGAAKGKGNFGLGSGSSAQADLAGRACGVRARVAYLRTG